MIYPAHAWPFHSAHPINGGKAPDDLQLAALNFGCDMDKVGYWFEQGLAKTVTDMAHFVHDIQFDKCDAGIVIAPSYLKSGWEDEAALWGFPYPVVTWPDRIGANVAKQPHRFIINYEALHQSGGAYFKDLIQERRYSVTLDESTAIKNNGGTLSKWVRYWCQDLKIRRTLSGTPMVQDVMDLYPQLRFMGMLNGVNPYQFKWTYSKMGGYKGRKVVALRDQNIPELHALISEIAFRALKKDWWKDAPEKLYNAVEIEMTSRQKIAYTTMLKEFYVGLENGEIVLAEQIIHMKQKLLQISRGFIIDTENEKVEEIVPPSQNPALHVLKEYLGTIPGKWICFCTRNYSVDMLSEQLKKFGIVVLRGGMDKSEIADVKLRFNTDPSIRGMVAMSSVGARGHTLLGTVEDRCAHTVYWENDYNLEIRLQSEDRNHRRGQDTNVSYTDFYCSQEDKLVIHALQKKLNMAQAIVDAVKRHPVLK